MSNSIDSIKVYINQLIDNFAYTDAIFLAERLYTEGRFSHLNHNKEENHFISF